MRFAECTRKPTDSESTDRVELGRVWGGRLAECRRRPRKPKYYKLVLPAALRETPGRKVCRGQKDTEVYGVNKPDATGIPAQDSRVKVLQRTGGDRGRRNQ